MELTEENAKIYGDAFAKASMPEIFKNIAIFTKGNEYISKFQTNEMKINKPAQANEKYFQTPLEGLYRKKSIWAKIKEAIAIFLYKENEIKLLEAGKPKKTATPKANIWDLSEYGNHQETLRKEENAEWVAKYGPNKNKTTDDGKNIR